MTNFEKIMQEMNPETMANLRVKQIIVNNSEPFYVTSTGQLYTFDKLNFLFLLVFYQDTFEVNLLNE